MESWFSTVPLNSQWVVLIDNYPRAISSEIIQGLEYTDGSKQGWNISRPAQILTSQFYQKVIGCIFAQGVSLPQEDCKPIDAPIENNRGFISGLLAGNRTNQSDKYLKIEFLETNTSFLDMVIRPWVILASHYGYVARPGGTADLRHIKCNLTVMQYTRSYQKVSQIPRKVWTFYNCVPYFVENQSISYSPDTEYEKYVTNWVYSNSTVHSNLYLPLPDVINRISNGVVPNISPFQNGNNFTNQNLPKTGLPGAFFCWVAREVYGEDNPKWLLFRQWMLTKSPKWFMHLYVAFGASFAKMIRNQTFIKNFIKKWMDSKIKEIF